MISSIQTKFVRLSEEGGYEYGYYAEGRKFVEGRCATYEAALQANSMSVQAAPDMRPKWRI